MQSLSVHAGYYDLLTYAGLTVLGHGERFGTTRGDYLFAVEKHGQYGVIIIGFGSCRGCDVLAGAKPPPGVQEWDQDNLAFIEIYARELANSVHWGTRDVLHQVLRHPMLSPLQWYTHEDGFTEALERVLARIPA